MSANGSSHALPNNLRSDAMPMPCRLGFLISDAAGPCLAVQKAITSGVLPGCTIALVICNITGAPGVEAARAAGLRAVTLEGRGHDQREHEEAIDALLRRMGVDLLCLSGYLRVLSRSFIRRWPGIILTGHASLLPAFPGPRPERQALEYGARVTGYTVSVLDEAAEIMGGGPVLIQRAVPILEEDTEATLAQRVAPEADIAYVAAIHRIASGLYELEGRRYVPRSREQKMIAVSEDLEWELDTEGIQVQESAPRR